MKYVIFKHITGAYMPVVFPDHVTHSTVKIEDAEPISAGFCSYTRGGVFILDAISESLNLGPSFLDRGLLESTFNNSGMYAFIEL